jgi:hypothetical protein
MSAQFVDEANMDENKPLPLERKHPNADTILAVAAQVLFVHLCCLGPALISDWISLNTDPTEMPSIMCYPPSRWAILIMFAREFVFLLAAAFSLFILVRSARQGMIWHDARRWGVPVVVFVVIIILATMNIPSPLQETPPCTGPVDYPIYGYPYAWIRHPGRWMATTDPYWGTFYPFSIYNLILNIVFLANLAICAIGVRGRACIRQMESAT